MQEAVSAAMSRPTMRFVPVKSAEEQAALMLAGLRDPMVRRRTQLTNAIRGYAGEFEEPLRAQGLSKIEALLVRIAEDEDQPELAKDIFAAYGQEYAELEGRIAKVEARLMAWFRQSGSQRLTQVPGIGPIIASMLVMKIPDPGAFHSARHFAAWLGLTPKDHSTAPASTAWG